MPGTRCAGCGVPMTAGRQNVMRTHLEHKPAAEVDTAHLCRAIWEGRIDWVVRKDITGEERDEDGRRGEGGSEGDHGSSRAKQQTQTRGSWW